MDNNPILALVGIFPAIAVFLAVYTRSKTVAAFAQLGGLQGREHTQEQIIDAQNSVDLVKPLKLQDKSSFTLGVLNVCITCYLMGAAPEYFYLWHTPKAVILISLRWYTFKQSKQHYLLYDFCYWANIMGLVYLWVKPTSARLFQIFFVVANGPLAWSVLTFSQSLVFHSQAHMTSVFIHVSPMLLSHALRWLPPEKVQRARIFQTAQPFAVCDPEGCGVSPWILWWNAMCYFYVPWLILYYVWVFLVLGPRIKSRSYQTLYDRVVSQGSSSRMLQRMFRLCGIETSRRLYKKAVYMLMHLAMGVVTCGLATLFWHSRVAHSTFIFAICGASIWNAAGFYFTVFAQRYESDLAASAQRLAGRAAAQAAQEKMRQDGHAAHAGVGKSG